MTERTIHGVLLSIDTCGLLLTGAAAVGKSLLALGLLARGHKLIADDTIDLSSEGNTVIGRCPEPLRGLLHLRGIGVIRVADHFGSDKLLAQHPIDLQIKLVDDWPDTDDENLLEGAFAQEPVHGIQLPCVQQVTRQLPDPVLWIETACREVQLRAGIPSAAGELSARQSTLLEA